MGQDDKIRNVQLSWSGFWRLYDWIYHKSPRVSRFLRFELNYFNELLQDPRLPCLLCSQVLHSLIQPYPISSRLNILKLRCQLSVLISLKLVCILNVVKIDVYFEWYVENIIRRSSELVLCGVVYFKRDCKQNAVRRGRNIWTRKLKFQFYVGIAPLKKLSVEA